MTDIIALLRGVRRTAGGWAALCPAHEDHTTSLSVTHREGRWLLYCHAGCTIETIVAALGLSIGALFDNSIGEGGLNRSINRATAQRSAGLTLAAYAEARGLPLDFLKSCALSDISYMGAPAVRIPYFGPGGDLFCVRFRIALEGDRFRWKSGAKPQLYGLDRLAEVRGAGQVTIVEGESDAQTLWHHGIPAVGLPGAANWREERDAVYFDGIETIYVVIEPDRGGAAVMSWLSQSAIRQRVKLLTLPTKDVSALHLKDPDGFSRAWGEALLGATPWTAAEANAQAEQRSTAWEGCAALAGTEDILEAFAAAIERAGLVGEARIAKLLYLAATSRLMERPVSIVVKGPSSGGKSFLVESVLRFFPDTAFYVLTAVSERALAYSTVPLKHRHIIMYEAAGMQGDFATYLFRSLLSEGRIRYETVEKTKDGLVAKTIEREGPTGLITTTTRLRLHPENETRMVSLTVTDTREQTAAIFAALARETAEVDVGEWHALQTWLAASPCGVTIPFAEALADLVPPTAVRLRRDFKTILTLIRAHALLHQATRRKNEAGKIIAEVADYAAVRELVADLVAEGVEATVKPETKQVVEAVATLVNGGKAEVTQAELKHSLRLDKSAVSRRVAAAVDQGALRNLEERKGRPARLVLGDPLPTEVEILPRPEVLHRLTVVGGV